MSRHLRLGVNIDHVATIRNARGGPHPDPVRAARLAASAGADGITAHLREDRRHMTDADIERLIADIELPLNLEMAATDEMLGIALLHCPHAACIVPERRAERTTEGGLDADGGRGHLARFVDALNAAGIRTSLFIEPDPQQIEAAAALAATVLPDLVKHYKMGFVGAAYTVAHECAELVLKLHLDSLGIEYSTFGREGHDLPKLFELWSDDRDNAEVAYQRWFVDFTVQNRLRDAIEKTLRLRDYADMDPSERASMESLNRATWEMQQAILREDDPSVAEVLGRIDAMIGPEDVRTLCVPARRQQFAEARYAASVWYPDKLLGLQWKELVQATGESRSLGTIRWFLEREGTPDVYSAWKYLHEGNLPRVGHQFRGPAIKMILIAKRLRIFASSATDNQ